MWYLPLPLAIVVADDCIEDYKIGYKNILVTKRGKNKYFVLNILKSFVISFLIIIIPLLLNLLMVHIVFAGGTYLFMDPESIKAIPSMAEYYSHPMFYNLLCILLLSLAGGVGKRCNGTCNGISKQIYSLSVNIYIVVYTVNC